VPWILNRALTIFGALIVTFSVVGFIFMFSYFLLLFAA